MTAALSLFCLSLAALWFIYGGFVNVLRFIAAIRNLAGSQIDTRNNGTDAQEGEIGLTVYFSAFNEEDNVDERIRDIVAQAYPMEKLEIIVVSDGSTDATATKAREFMDAHPAWNVRLFEFPERKGKAAAQNLVAGRARHDILVMTDAETRFEPGVLAKISAAFHDQKVGVVGIRLEYRPSNYELARAINQYRKKEWEIRSLETRLGVLCKTDGPCTAYRRCLWDHLRDFEDVDQVIVLLARQRGFIAVHLDDAIALEHQYETPRQELLARSRMTRKALLSTFHRWRWKDVVRQPLFSLTLFAHKIVRFFSPLFLLLLLGSAIFLAYVTEILLCLLLAVLAVLFIFIINAMLVRSPAISRIFARLGSFFLANIGFSRGIWGWLSGDRTGLYPPAKSLRSE